MRITETVKKILDWYESDPLGVDGLSNIVDIYLGKT